MGTKQYPGRDSKIEEIEAEKAAYVPENGVRAMIQEEYQKRKADLFKHIHEFQQFVDDNAKYLFNQPQIRVATGPDGYYTVVASDKLKLIELATSIVGATNAPLGTVINTSNPQGSNFMHPQGNGGVMLGPGMTLK